MLSIPDLIILIDIPQNEIITNTLLFFLDFFFPKEGNSTNISSRVSNQFGFLNEHSYRLQFSLLISSERFKEKNFVQILHCLVESLGCDSKPHSTI